MRYFLSFSLSSKEEHNWELKWFEFHPVAQHKEPLKVLREKEI